MAYAWNCRPGNSGHRPDLGPTDTDMTAAFDVPKSDPAAIVQAGLDGLEAGVWKVIADEMPRVAKAALAGDPREYYARQ